MRHLSVLFVIWKKNIFNIKIIRVFTKLGLISLVQERGYYYWLSPLNFGFIAPFLH